MAGLEIGDPVTLAQVLASNNIFPGDTIRLRAGTYSGNWLANIGGTLAAPVKIMPYNGEAVKIDGTWLFGNLPAVRLLCDRGGMKRDQLRADAPVLWTWRRMMAMTAELWRCRRYVRRETRRERRKGVRASKT